MGDDMLVEIDPFEIGWWIESSDESFYGPVSRATLRRFVEEGHVSPNTLVRHVTQPDTKPMADQVGMMAGLKPAPGAASGGDRLSEVWPRKWRDQQALAETAIPCARHKKPAVSFCVRCRAPYCNSCRTKPYGEPFFFCRHCQSNNHNRRFIALIVDGIVFVYAPMLGAVAVFGVANEVLINLVQLGGGAVILVRDSLFNGAAPGKRLMGLRVVNIEDEAKPISYGQGVLRWLSQLIPIYSLFDAFAPLRDPLQRRYGDRWAGTRVVDTPSKRVKARAKIQKWLANKGFTVPEEAEPEPVAPLA